MLMALLGQIEALAPVRFLAKANGPYPLISALHDLGICVMPVCRSALKSRSTSGLLGGLKSLCVTGLLFFLCATASPGYAQMVSGEALFRQRCASCHSIGGRSFIGPDLAGVAGRQAGTHPTGRYSEALRTSGIVWSDEALDRFLADPRGLVPGTRMSIAIKDATQRTALIDFLKSQSVSKETTP